MPRMTKRTGGRILVDQLRIQGCDRIFTVPGESFLAVLDALHDTPEIETIVCRQEGGVAYMADADGKLTGRPGVAFVTRGPGATNASAGVHVAFQDSTPMILFIGDVARGDRDREGFQEIDFPAFFSPIAKWAARIEDARRIPEYVARAFRVAMSGRPGPVVVALPEDMLSSLAVTGDAERVEPVTVAPSTSHLERLQEILRSARRPLVIAGGGGWTMQACADLVRFAELNQLPIASAFRNQDVIDNDHPHYAGEVGIAINPRLADRVRNADVLLVFGERLGEMVTSGYSLLESPSPRQQLVHVLPGGDDLGTVYQPALAIEASLPAFAAAVANLEPVVSTAWSGSAALLTPSTFHGKPQERRSVPSICGRWSKR